MTFSHAGHLCFSGYSGSFLHYISFHKHTMALFLSINQKIINSERHKTAHATAFQPTMQWLEIVTVYRCAGLQFCSISQLDCLYIFITKLQIFIAVNFYLSFKLKTANMHIVSTKIGNSYSVQFDYIQFNSNQIFLFTLVQINAV